ncbi:MULTISPECIES: (2Fe-2S)-binding protein [unclassified Romboutsia]|uniref:(2Fe-2S)-binding protein n=1 Tax=unclassified Romboutsia TaxID=2626894 RepID=UPI0008206580|nr:MULTISPECIES: (2Fe-2S)-binding protein [unclassified Romboutsia]SCH50028.1 nitrite reductase subunit NirD [uncultured Clostridium sp.]
MSNSQKVCGCFNVTVQDLIDAKEKGCKSVKEIMNETHAGKACGRCRQKAEITIIKVLQNRLYIK